MLTGVLEGRATGIGAPVIAGVRRRGRESGCATLNCLRKRREPTAQCRVCAHPPAGVAQLVEQLIRNQQVIGSSPIAGSSTVPFTSVAALEAY